MLNTLWTVLLLAGIGWGTLTGNARATGEALLGGAASGVSLCMTMFGVLALWSGILEIASTSGLMDAISRRMRRCFTGSSLGFRTGIRRSRRLRQT